MDINFNGLEDIIAVIDVDVGDSGCLYTRPDGKLLIASGDHELSPAFVYTGVTVTLSEEDMSLLHDVIFTEDEAVARGFIPLPLPLTPECLSMLRQQFQNKNPKEGML